MRRTKLIAEIGWNHMGDLDLAKRMIEAAAKNGADIVKFQTWSQKNLVPGPWDTDGRKEIYKKAELTRAAHELLLRACKDNGVEFSTSLFSLKDLDKIEGLGIRTLKVPSHEIHNRELIERLAGMCEVLLVSTGASSWSEVEAAAEILRRSSCESVLLHCVSSYPCESDMVNLPRISKLKTLGPRVGYSGHYFGIEDAILSMPLGATYIEKHFTIDRELPGRDNKFALLPEDFRKLSAYRDSWDAMSLDRGVDFQRSETDIIEKYRGRWNAG